MPRTNISIADEIADGLSEQALKRNKTLYAFANESLEAVISVCKLSGEPSEVLPSWKMGRMLKEVDAVPLPGDLLEKIIKKLYETERDWLLKTWFAEGRRIGSYLSMGYQELPNLAQAAVEFQGLLPLRRLEFRNVETTDSKTQMAVRAIGAGISMEATTCAEQFIRGVVDAYGWTVKNSKTAEGMIELQVSKEKRQSSSQT
jgi:hypothetical protein